MREILLFVLLLSGMVARAQFVPEGNCKTYFEHEVNTQVMTLLPATAINFYDRSEGNVVAWWWDFGDGTYSEKQNPMHLYNLPYPGETVKISPYRTISLTTLTADSCKSFYSETINIMGNEDPMPGKECKAIFKYYQADYDSINGKVTFQLNNYSEGKSLQYNWDFGDGRTSNDFEPTVTFDVKPAEHKVCLTVTGGEDCGDTFCDVLYFSAPEKPDPNQCYTGFSYKVNYDIKTYAPALVLDFYAKPLPETMKWEWDFGDGETSSEQNPTHIFNLPIGNDSLYAGFSPFRKVCLTATSASGCTATYCESIYLYRDTISPIDPSPQCHAWFKFEKLEDIISISEAIPYKLHDVSEGDVVSRLWRFEDGTTSTEVDPVVFFNFMKPTQKVCLTITTADNCSSSWCDIVYLHEVQPDSSTVDKPLWHYEMRYESYFPVQMSSCAGWARAQVYMKDSIVDAYNYVWSTGEIGQEVKGLCPTQTYSVKAITPDGTVVTGTFVFNSDGSVNETPVNWWITDTRNNPQIQVKPVSDEYTVEWKLCDGTTVVGDSVALELINCGTSDSNLIMKDAYGNIIYSETINMKILATYINQKNRDNAMKIYPNPVKDVLNITYSGEPVGEMIIEISDLSGRIFLVQTVKQVDAGQTIGLNVNALRSGVYMCRTISGDKLLNVQKFIK